MITSLRYSSLMVRVLLSAKELAAQKGCSVTTIYRVSRLDVEFRRQLARNFGKATVEDMEAAFKRHPARWGKFVSR